MAKKRDEGIASQNGEGLYTQVKVIYERRDREDDDKRYK